MCDGRRFQADGAATEKELLESWQLNRGTIKSPRDVDRSQMSEHGKFPSMFVFHSLYIFRDDEPA